MRQMAEQQRMKDRDSGHPAARRVLAAARQQNPIGADQSDTIPDLPRSSELKNFSSSSTSSELSTTPANEPSGLVTRRTNWSVSRLVTWPTIGSLM